MIIIAGHFDFADGKTRDAAVTDSAAPQQATRDDEPGCLAYSFSADPCIENRMLVYELWTNAEALADHFVHPNYDGMRRVLRSHERVGSEALKYRCDMSEPVYDETGIARADFFTATS